MLHDLTKGNGGYAAFKQAAEDGGDTVEWNQKPALQHKTKEKT